MPPVTRSNVDSLIASTLRVYRAYFDELFSGFIAEREGAYDQAHNHYLTSLQIPVHEEPSYYAHRDLARLALKKGDFRSARGHLAEYLRLLTVEIRGAESNRLEDLEALWREFPGIGYQPDSETLQSMKTEQSRLEPVLQTLDSLIEARVPP